MERAALMPVSWGADHRAVDGAAVARCCARFGDEIDASVSIDVAEKVALLLHFNDQLRSGAAVAAGGGTPCRQAGCGGAGDALYVKRWVKTQHASIFRFSNRTIQVCFKDRSYIHLCTREKYVTYMDKHGSRALIMLAALPKVKMPLWILLVV